MNLYVVRHGETDWNKKGIFHGDTDIPLNDNGRKQALEVKEKLSDKKIDLCFTSPLVRAKETANIITENKIPINISPLLVERDFGIFEGKITKDQIDSSIYWDYKLNLSDNGVESVQDLFKRIAFFLRYLSENYQNENILIVSHGATIRALNYLIVGFSEDEKFLEFDIRNCSIFEYNL